MTKTFRDAIIRMNHHQVLANQGALERLRNGGMGAQWQAANDSLTDKFMLARIWIKQNLEAA